MCRSVGSARWLVSRAPPSAATEPFQPFPERRLRSRLRTLAKDNLRYGYRRLHALLLREGYAVNQKPVQLLST